MTWKVQRRKRWKGQYLELTARRNGRIRNRQQRGCIGSYQQVWYFGCSTFETRLIRLTNWSDIARHQGKVWNFQSASQENQVESQLFHWRICQENVDPNSWNEWSWHSQCLQWRRNHCSLRELRLGWDRAIWKSLWTSDWWTWEENDNEWCGTAYSCISRVWPCSCRVVSWVCKSSS